MGIKDHTTGGAFLPFVLNATLRFLQFIFGIVVIGLYAQDLNKAHHEGKYADGKWIFATIIGTLGAFTALVYGLLPLFLSAFSVAILFAWDAILFILWTAVFGLFGSMYIHEKAEMDGGVKRMKHAVWIDLINMLLWLISALVGAIGFWRWMRGGRSLHTGRARV